MSARVPWRRRLAQLLLRLAVRLDPARGVTITVGDTIVTLMDGRVCILTARIVSEPIACAALPAAAEPAA